MGTLAHLIDAPGASAATLAVHVAPRGLDVEVRGVSIHDLADPTPCAAGDVVALVGLPPGTVPLETLRSIAACDGAAVIIKSAGAVDPPALLAAETAGIALLSVPAGTPWARILVALRSAVSEQLIEAAGEPLGGVLSGDLFALANAIAVLMDGPVTIEDPQLRVLAFSNRQEKTDPARVGSILGHQTPEPFLQRMRQRGVIRRIYASERPVFVGGLEPDTLPRVAVAVRAGGEVVGSIWVVVDKRPSRDRMSALKDAAIATSLHLVRHRITGDARREIRTELVQRVLNGGPAAADAARRLGLGQRHHVVAVGMRAGDEDVAMAARSRLWELLQLHLGAIHRDAQTCLQDQVVYGIIPTTARAGNNAALLQTMEQFLQRVRPVVALPVRVGIGDVAESLADIPQARAQADRVLRGLLADPQAPEIADLTATWVPSLLVRLAELAPTELAAGRRVLEQLREHDAKHSTKYVETVHSWLRHFGDTAAVARELGVHDNTIRLRRRTLAALQIVDLSSGDQRLGLMLLLRLAELGGGDEEP